MVNVPEFAHGQFSWVDLSAHNMAAAGEFYSGVFGWNVVMQDTQGGPPYAQFELESDPVAGLGQMSPEMQAHGIPPMWNSYVNVDDIDATVAKAEELGATVTVPVMKVMDAGQIAFIMDPCGASLAFWQKGTHAGASRINEPGTFCWNELATRDTETAKQFYENLLGWNIVEHHSEPAEYLLIMQGDTNRGGIIKITDEWGEVPSHWGVYFAVADTDETVRLAEKGGGCARRKAFDTDVGRMAVLADPQGAGFSVLNLKDVC